MKSLRTTGLVGLLGLGCSAPVPQTTTGLPIPYRIEQAPLCDSSVVDTTTVARLNQRDDLVVVDSSYIRYGGICVLCPDSKGKYALHPSLK